MSRYTVTVTGPDGQTFEEGWPSVTEIIEQVLAKPGLADWYYKQGVAGLSILLDKYGGKLPSDIPSLQSLMKQEGLSPYAQRDAAASSGQDIHEAVYGLSKRPQEASVKKSHPALFEWWQDKGLKKQTVLAAEQVVVSWRNKYAGTLDLVYTQDSSVCLSDVKSGKVRESHAVQLELYRWAWEENGGEKVDRMSIIQVPRDGSPVTEHEVFLTDELTVAASGILSVHKWSSKKGRKG